jgi:hypothetical protein
VGDLVPPRRLRAPVQAAVRAAWPDGRRARAPFGEAAIAAALAWNPTAVDELESWPEQRYLDYLDAIETDADLGGVGEVRRVVYSDGALRHLLASYAESLACRLDGVPAAFAVGPTMPARDVAATETASVVDCAMTTLGPYQVAPGAALSAQLLGGGGDVDVYVRRGAPPTLDAYDCRSTDVGAVDRCAVDAPDGGPVYVGLLGVSGGGATARRAGGHRLSPGGSGPAGVPGRPVPRRQRGHQGRVEPRLRRHAGAHVRHQRAAMGPLVEPGGLADWGPGAGGALPGPDEIYTITTPSDATFRLTGLHIMSKELPHWMWITLWWSDTPDDDFGADRPAAIAALPGPWGHYKMAVSVAYLEEDADTTGGADGTLGDALAATHGGVGQPTWTSNPFIELGAGNAATNCIGCHQHGGTDEVSEVIIADPARFPHHGRTQVRNNFATDYSWAILGGRGDELAAIVQNEVDYWAAAEE